MASIWTRPHASGSFPSARCAHTLAVIASNLYVFGGFDGSKMLNDLYIFRTDQMSWSKTVTTGKAASPRAGHTAVAYGSKLIVFGGGDGSRYLNDVIALDTERMEWSPIVATGMAPSARSRHTATVIGKKMFVMGGGDESMVYNDLHELNLETFTWTRIEARGTIPSARWGHTTCLATKDANNAENSSELIVVGGHDGNNMLNDVFRFDIASRTWSSQPCKGTPPSARAGHTTDRVGRHLVLFGGGNGVKILNDVHILYLDTFTWHTASHLDNPPTARCAHTTALVDEALHQLIVYGGGDGQRRFKDLYTLNVDKLLKHEENKQSSQQRGGNTPRKVHENRATPAPASVSASSSSSSASAPSANSSAIVAWLETIGMGQYSHHFVREEISMDLLPLLTEQHLAEQLGVGTIGARLRLMKAIERLNPSLSPSPSPSPSPSALKASERSINRSQEMGRVDSSTPPSSLPTSPQLRLGQSQEFKNLHPQQLSYQQQLQQQQQQQQVDVAALQLTIEKLSKTVAQLSTSLLSLGIPVAAPES